MADSHAALERGLIDAAAPGRLTLFLRSCQLGAFGTLFVIQKKASRGAARRAAQRLTSSARSPALTLSCRPAAPRRAAPGRARAAPLAFPRRPHPQVHASTARSVLGSLVRWAQMASFCFVPYFHHWRAALTPVREALGVVTVHYYFYFMDAPTYLGLYYSSLVWASIFVILFAWAMQSFVRSSFSALWPLKLLRCEWGARRRRR